MMVYQAHVHREPARLLVLDDRGTPTTRLDLPGSPTGPDEADEPLSAAGWTRTAEWSTTQDGWQAPVVAQDTST